MNRRFTYIQNTSASEDVGSILPDSVVVDQKTKIAYTGISFHPDGFLHHHVSDFVLSEEPRGKSRAAETRRLREIENWPYRRRA